MRILTPSGSHGYDVNLQDPVFHLGADAATHDVTEKELSTAMLIALNTTATRVSAEDATRGDYYRCPACQDDVTLKQGAHVIWHFAHRAGSSCRHGDGESLRHLEMKAKVGNRLIARDLNVDYEVRIEHGKRHRITDLLINDPAVGVDVIECQV